MLIFIALLAVTGAPIDADAAVVQALRNARSLTVDRADIERRRRRGDRVNLNDVRVGVDHFGVAQVVDPAVPVSILDNAQLQVSWRPPQLDEFGLDQAIAAADVEVTALGLEAKMRNIAAETRLLHARILLAREEKALAKAALVLLASVRDITAEKRKLSAATQVELGIAAMDLLDAQVEYEDIDARITREEARLRRLLGYDDDGALDLAGEVPACRTAGDVETILATARAHSPRLRALALKRSAADLQNQRESLRPIPWFDRLRLGYLNSRPLDGRPEIHVGVDIDLPVFALLDGGSDDVDLARIKLEAEVLEAEDDLETDVAGAVLRQQTAAKLYDDHARATELVSNESTSSVDAAFAQGGADAVGVAVVHGRAVKSRRVLLKARNRCVEAVIDLWRTTGAVMPADAP